VLKHYLSCANFNHVRISLNDILFIFLYIARDLMIDALQADHG
jgi:hypothetical protein